MAKRRAATAWPTIGLVEGYVSYLDRYSLPGRFDATFDHLACRVTLDVVMIGGGPTCAGLHLERRPGDKEITGATIRLVPVGRLLEAAIAAAAMVVEGNVSRPFRSVEEFRRFSWTPRRSEPARRWRLTAEHLTDVMTLYEDAAPLGAPVRAVQAKFGVPRPTASRWVALARERGIKGGR